MNSFALQASAFYAVHLRRGTEKGNRWGGGLNDECTLKPVTHEGGRGGRRSNGRPRGRGRSGKASSETSSNPSDVSSSVNATSGEAGDSSAFSQGGRRHVRSRVDRHGRCRYCRASPRTTANGAHCVGNIIAWTTRLHQHNKPTLS